MSNKIKDIGYYIQGNIRYKIFYSKFAFLLSNTIREQIQARINSMNLECFEQGSCIKCGCNTTHLQMCNKPCEGDCYPRMLNKQEWINIKKNSFNTKSNNSRQIWSLDVKNLKFIKWI